MHVYVATPVYRSFEVGYVKSLVTLLRTPGFSWHPVAGDGLIQRARGILATDFLKSDADCLLFVDSDMVGFTPEDTRAMCELTEQYDIVSASYVGRTEGQNAVQQIYEIGKPVIHAFDHTPVPIKWATTGFMAVHRRVFEKMAEGLRLLHPSKPFAFYNFFPIFEHDDADLGEPILLSEDYGFSERARELGFQVTCDPAVRVGHAGTYVYRLEELGHVQPEAMPLEITRVAPYKWRTRSLEPEEIKRELIPTS